MIFGNTKIIIYLGLTKLVVGDCRHSKPIYFELPYKNDLNLAFDKIIEQLPSSSYKIILGKDVSYTVRLDKMSKTQDRIQVKDELVKHIPESFEDTQFDWRIDNEQQIEAIVISTNTYHGLQAIRSKYPNIRLETQSATSLLSEMGSSTDESEVSPELFDFAAQKGREHGKDEIVLNIDIEPKKGLENASSHKQKNYLKIIPIIITIILSLVIGWFVWTKRTKPTPLTTPVSSQSPSPSPSVAPVKNQSDFRVIIQNGTKKAGFASETKTKLEAAGFTQIDTGNAKEESTYTTINVAEAIPDTIQNILIKSLNPLEPIITIEGVDTDLNIGDIVIILGTK